jgi:glutaredoxin
MKWVFGLLKISRFNTSDSGPKFLIPKTNQSVWFLLFIISIFLLAGCSKSTDTKNYDSLATCMTAAGATMYGTEWCPHCKAQKEMFGNSFKLINYVDCDKRLDDCKNAGVEGYPTWSINGSLYPGTQNLYILASKTGCVAELESATQI